MNKKHLVIQNDKISLLKRNKYPRVSRNSEQKHIFYNLEYSWGKDNICFEILIPRVKNGEESMKK